MLYLKESKVVGRARKNVSSKSVRKSKHLFRSFNGYAISEDILKDLRDRGMESIVLKEKEEGKTYFSIVTEFFYTHGEHINFHNDPQICCGPLNHYTYIITWNTRSAIVYKWRSHLFFLGSTHYWGKSQQNNWVIKRKTAAKRLRRSMRNVWDWCRKNRHLPLRELYRMLCLKLNGHYQYYGFQGNFVKVSQKNVRKPTRPSALLSFPYRDWTAIEIPACVNLSFPSFVRFLGLCILAMRPF